MERGIGGRSALDYLIKVEGYSFLEAAELIMSQASLQPPEILPAEKTKEKILLLPEPYRCCDYVVFYLKSRGIDSDLIRFCIRTGRLYESRNYHNAVFVGFDKNSIPRHANKRGIGRGSTFKGNAASSMDEFAFHRIGKGKSLYLFEAPIDMLSFISIHKENWKKHSYAASCSVSDRVLFQCLNDYPHIEKVYLCLDNDEPGQTAADRISTKLFAFGIESEILIPIHKDWNEDLLTTEENEKIGDETQCPVLQL